MLEKLEKLCGNGFYKYRYAHPESVVTRERLLSPKIFFTIIPIIQLTKNAYRNNV